MSHDESVHDSHDEERQDEQDDIQQNGEHLLPGRLGPHLSALPATCEHELTISGHQQTESWLHSAVNGPRSHGCSGAGVAGRRSIGAIVVESRSE